jgi:hypothetical protein
VALCPLFEILHRRGTKNISKLQIFGVLFGVLAVSGDLSNFFVPKNSSNKMLLYLEVFPYFRS